MKKKHSSERLLWWLSKHDILSPILLILLCLLIWFFGALSTQHSLWPFKGIFGDTNQLENAFSPVNSIFSGLAGVGVLYALYRQTIEFRMQQFRSDFFDMLNIHRDNRNNMTYDRGGVHNDTKGPEAFRSYYELLRHAWLIFQGQDDDEFDEAIGLKNRDLFNDHYSQLLDENGNPNKTNHELFQNAFRMFDQEVHSALWHYFRHLYHLVKYTHENAPPHKKASFFAILRAQLTTYEHLLLYYNALMSPDKFHEDDDGSKWKYYISENRLLHNMDIMLRFDNGAAGNYEQRAFE